MLRVKAAADEVLTIDAVVADKEGNVIGPIAPENVGLQIQGFTGNFGEVIEGTNGINPGSPEAVGVVRISDKTNESLGFVDVEVVLETGAPAKLSARFSQNGVELPIEQTPPLGDL